MERDRYYQREKYDTCARKLDSNVIKNICNDISMLTEEKNEADKYKKILGSKKPIVVLKNCLMSDNVLDVSLKYSNLLTYRIPNIKLESSNNEIDITSVNCKSSSIRNSHLLDMSSKDFKTRKLQLMRLYQMQTRSRSKNKSSEVIQNNLITPYLSIDSKIEKSKDRGTFFKRQTPITIKDDSNCNEEYTQIMKDKALKDGKRLKICLERIVQYDQNSNIIETCSELKALRKNENVLGIENNDENIEFPYVPIHSEEIIQNKTNTISDIIYIENTNLDENKNLFIQKRKIINQDSETTKKIKLNTHLFQNNEDNCEKINICDSERNIAFKSNSDKTTQPKSNETNLNFIKQSKIENLCNIKQNQSFLSDKNNFNEEQTDVEDDDTDCISLFADSTLIEEYELPSVHNSLYTEQSYHMVNDVFDNYYRTNASEFNKIYTNNVNNTEINISKEIKTISESKQPALIILDNIKTPKKKKTVNSPQLGIFANIFQGYCFSTIKTGRCNNKNCPFNHDFMSIMIRFYFTNEQHYFSILDKLVLQNLTNFIYIIFHPPLLYISSNSDMNCTLKTVKKLYELQIRNDKGIIEMIELLHKDKIPIKCIIDQLVTIVNDSDFEFVNWILKILKNYIVHGEYWDTLKSLLLKIENLEPEIVEIILQECVTTQKNIHDVNVNIMRKLANQTRSQINQKLLSSFKNFIKCSTGNSLSAKKHFPTSTTYNIKSPEHLSTVRESETELNIDEYTKILNTRDMVWQRNKKCISSNNNLQNKNSNFTLHEIDELFEPHSAHGRAKFWKFYIDVYRLQKGLEHNDYDYVIHILNSAKQHQRSFFSRACYQILCNEIKYSQYRLSKLISHTVQTGATAIFYQILLDVAIHILARLAEKNLWVIAHILLKDIYTILNIENVCSYECDAATIMLLAEIYLANQQAVEAYRLLKQTNIIYTNPSKWKVKSNVKDNSIRAKIITLLLDTFCKLFPEYAFFLFQFLIVDQCGNFYPIDLAHFANKMIPLLLLKKDHEMIIQIGKLIDKYNFTINAITYRALIATLVHIDIALAKHLYQTAISLGIYFKVQFHPTTYLIINSDWTNEEIYLAILNLIEELSSNIGHAINHVNPNILSVYLVFENISFKEQFIYNEKINLQYDVRIAQSKIQVKKVLQTQFNPPIFLRKNRAGRIYKISSASVLRYLKSKYCE